MDAADPPRDVPSSVGEPIAIIGGGGTLPEAVAAAADRAGRRVVMFPLRGAVDPASLHGRSHHWIRAGQFGRFRRLARQERCRDVVLIGSLIRPTLWQLWPDYGAIAQLPRLLTLFRGGDDHLLSGVANAFEQSGFRVLGAHEVAPELGMPAGPLGGRDASPRDRDDIARGLALLAANAPFDVGQAVVVADRRVLAVEAAEGTDRMLDHLATLRREGHVRAPRGIGVLVKAPKRGQDRRVDLPTIGPQTVEKAAAAGLAGIAVVAGSAIVAEADRIGGVADRAGLFVIGVADHASP